MAGKEENQSKINSTLVNALVPKGIKFDKDIFSYGEAEAVGMSVTRFPSVAQYEWLTSVCNIPSTITAMTYTPEENTEDILWC